MVRRSSILLAAAALAAASHPAAATAQAPSADRVAIGVIDTKVNEAAWPEGVSVYYRFVGDKRLPEGVEIENGRTTHGDLVVNSIRDARTRSGDARPYDVYVANPFVRNEAGNLAITWTALSDSLDWFKEHGVKVVSTTFAATQSNAVMDAFMAKAAKEGMVVVASVGNGDTKGVPFPAAYPSAVAVDGHAYLHGRKLAPLMERADATFSGATGVILRPYGDKPGEDVDTAAMGQSSPGELIEGSSFAAGRAAGFLAARLSPDATVDDARALLRSAGPAGRPIDLAQAVPSAPWPSRTVVATVSMPKGPVALASLSAVPKQAAER